MATPTKTSTISLDVAHLRGIDGLKLQHILSDWLQKPNLREVILISFGFNPRQRIGGIRFSERLAMLAESAIPITCVTTLKDEGPQSYPSVYSRKLQELRRLAASGIVVSLHETLHAKVCLLRQEDRFFWSVGSSNLTRGGLWENDEVNVCGYRLEEYTEVYTKAQSIIDQAYQL